MPCNTKKHQNNRRSKARGHRSNRKSRRRRRRRSRRHRSHRQHHRRAGVFKGMRGGVQKLGFSAFPPGGPVHPSSTTNGLDGGYYYAKNNNTVEPPANISASSVGGSRHRTRHRRHRKKKKSRKTRKHMRRSARRRRRRRRRGRRSRKGGGRLSRLLPSAIESFPFGTDMRDAYWKAGSTLTNTWNTWNGQPNNMSPDPAVQPIGSQGLLGFSPQPDMADIVHDTSMQAAKYT